MTPDPTPSDLARLREIAEKATQGTWSRSGSRSDLFDGHRPVNGHQVYRENDQIGIAHVYYDKRTGEGLSDANHIAAFDPPTCLGLIDALSSERTARQEAEARAEAAERERDELRLDITGGEDAPGHNASLSHQTIRDILAENYRSWRDSSDRYVTASDQLAAAREALEEAARVAAGPDYPALRAAIERTRAALAPHPEKEEADQCPACWLDISPEQCGSQHCPRKSGKPVPANPVDRATRAVGERVYQRVAELMSAAPGTPEADELNRLADLVAAVEDGLDPDHV